MLVKLAQAKWRVVAKKILEKDFEKINFKDTHFLQKMQVLPDKLNSVQSRLDSAKTNLYKTRFMNGSAGIGNLGNLPNHNHLKMFSTDRFKEELNPLKASVRSLYDHMERIGPRFIGGGNYNLKPPLIKLSNELDLSHLKEDKKELNKLKANAQGIIDTINKMQKDDKNAMNKIKKPKTFKENILDNDGKKKILTGALIGAALGGVTSGPGGDFGDVIQGGLLGAAGGAGYSYYKNSRS